MPKNDPLITSGLTQCRALPRPNITGYYSIQDIKLPEEPASGIYIVTYDDGTAEKKVKK